MQKRPFRHAFIQSGLPSSNKVRRQIESKKDKKTKKQCDSLQRPMVVIPYVENFFEAVARMMR